MNLQEQLAKYFISGYWDHWNSRFGHNFWTVHIVRTEEYNDSFVKDELSGKKILEVGGYPGLLMALYHLNGCAVTAIDSPMYRPDHYLDFVERWNFRSIVHDINSGAPPTEETFDAMVMSDVIMHNEGFPTEFMKWAINHCGLIYIVNYANADGNINPPGAHTLRGSWPIPPALLVKSHMESLGAKFSHAKDVADREVIIFKGKSNE
jgi:hypothetical protein